MPTAAEIDAAFERYHEKHPDVYDLFCRYARELKRTGMKRYSARAIMHRIRWHRWTSAHPVDRTFKVSNYWSARYARMYATDHPDEAQFFGFRRAKTTIGNVDEEPDPPPARETLFE